MNRAGTRAGQDTKRLDWWESHLNYEHGTDYEDGGVTLYKMTGSINDRVWTEVANAATLREVLDIVLVNDKGGVAR